MTAQAGAADVFEMLERDSLSAKAYVKIRQALMTGELQPGQKLNGREIAIRLGTSLTPVREALLQLVAEGVLEARSRQSITVPIPTRSVYAELRDLRVEVEGLGAERAATLATAEVVDELAALHDALVTAKAQGDYPLALRCNQAFHLGLCREAQLPRLLKIVEGLWAQSGPFLNFLYGDNKEWPVPKGAHDHVAVIEALRRHDGAGARAAIVRDIVTGGAGVMRRLQD